MRPENTAVQDDKARPGLGYRHLVQRYGRDRLALYLADIRCFGHPFHDDIFAVLRALGRLDGRLALCCVGH